MSSMTPDKPVGFHQSKPVRDAAWSLILKITALVAELVFPLSEYNTDSQNLRIL